MMVRRESAHRIMFSLQKKNGHGKKATLFACHMIQIYSRCSQNLNPSSLSTSDRLKLWRNATTGKEGGMAHKKVGVAKKSGHGKCKNFPRAMRALEI